MNMICDTLVNVSPIIVIFILYTIYKGCKEEKVYWSILCVVGCILLGFSLMGVKLGYGLFLISVIVLILGMTIYAVFMYTSFRDKEPLSAICYICFEICLLYLMYNRLKYEGIIESEFIDKLKNVNVFEIFSSITQNEWFKGIFIAALGGIISGLVLNKISKKK